MRTLSNHGLSALRHRARDCRAPHTINQGWIDHPAPNPFLPSDLALKPGKDPQPRVVTDEEDHLAVGNGHRVWRARAVTHVSIRSDRGLISEDVVASNLYAYLVKDDPIRWATRRFGVSFEVATHPEL